MFGRRRGCRTPDCSPGCGSRCPGGCCSDFSSRAERLPKLTSIEVVHGLLLQACRNEAARHLGVLSGRLDPGEAEEKTEALRRWFTLTFTGKNRHFEPDRDWLPAGLAYHLRENEPQILGSARWAADARAVEAAVGTLIEELTGLIVPLCEGDALGEDPEDYYTRFADRWAGILTGMVTPE